MTASDQNGKAGGFDQWCIVELFGHQKTAGRVTEQVIGGAAFVRIDVPESNGHPAFTKFYGAAAIYALTPCSEAAARAAIAAWRPEPVHAYELAALTARTHEIEADEPY